MNIHGINKLTLLDYPGKLACLLFTGRCNYRCPFCHNASLVLRPNSQPVIQESEIFDFLELRKGTLEGVCISGGEPTLNPDLPDFIKRIKELGYAVKLDTNGTNPAMLSSLLKEQVLDMVAMDIKNSKEKYALTCGRPNTDLAPIEESVSLLMNSGISYEFRTTYVQEFHELSDVSAIGTWLNGASNYYLQSYKDSGDIIGDGYHALSREEMQLFLETARPYFKNAELRGI